jgi:hypothetical protein
MRRAALRANEEAEEEEEEAEAAAAAAAAAACDDDGEGGEESFAAALKAAGEAHEAVLALQVGITTYYGATYYGATYYGATYYGATYYGATYYGAAHYGCTRYSLYLRLTAHHLGAGGVHSLRTNTILLSMHHSVLLPLALTPTRPSATPSYSPWRAWQQ